MKCFRIIYLVQDKEPTKQLKVEEFHVAESFQDVVGEVIRHTVNFTDESTTPLSIEELCPVLTIIKPNETKTKEEI